MTTDLEIVSEEEVPSDLRLAISSEMPDFEEIILTRKKLLAKVDKFTPVDDPEDSPRMKEAARLRLDLVKCRTGLERIRKAAGETARKRVDAINEMFRAWREDNEEAEAFLKESEEFGIRYEASRKAELQRERANELAKWTDEVVLTLGELTTAMWEITLAGAKAAKEAAEAAAKAAAEKAAEEAAEREKLRAENQRLLDQQAAERAEAEALIKAEQDKAKAAADAAAALRAKEQEVAKEAMRAAQAEIDKANAEKAALERKERARIAAEQKKAADAKAAEEAAALAAAKAPDKEKLSALLDEHKDHLADSKGLKLASLDAQNLLHAFCSSIEKALGEFEWRIAKL